ncbi:unnamed protein product [Didymodactylos carnosus]|uniref:Uncharacterized protein n=1 Tax=Didymodactylos carnosus TaxID=1234261 RepID=A0A813PTD9_9BILA|nr:unnamed protein product [Didymodactylos carnosus]CAF0819725.1 unnamed protein product [Didymodactylos carnosus]CAF3538381.1 unnamed protein product [Didymodactylos carnosus]CAF3603899.1 unnamed protein product [Didymodactylos carnosus]
MSDESESTSKSDSGEPKHSGDTNNSPDKKKQESLFAYVGDVISKSSRSQSDDALNTDEKGHKISIIRQRSRSADILDADSEVSSAFDPYPQNERKNDTADFNYDTSPLIERRESKQQNYKQPVYLKQIQPPTPDPVEIQVHEVLVKPQIQPRPIHVRIAAREQKTPSPILIQSQPPNPLPQLEQNIVYKKFIPSPQHAHSQQVIIHRYPELPPKPRPIIIEQWLPYKPAPKRITYRHIDQNELQQTVQQQKNIIIEYSKPRATIEVELIRLPIQRQNPSQYKSVSHLKDFVVSNDRDRNDPSSLLWRI